MIIQQLLKSIEIIGAIALFGGLIILTFLHVKINKRLNKNYVTFLSVFKTPSNHLLESDKRLRKIGGYLLLSGVIISVFSNIISFGISYFRIYISH
ncbi:MAG: hypothetical protein SRB2_03742 [Desulfobacteraceae bacterium Eth-SRB2]|nr:MAG: hypothetical protein SRB2_03742 [Desulfobacteraceae bacterium Eth-SRB2]